MQKLTKRDIVTAVVEFSNMQQKKKQLDKKFNERKAGFYKLMSDALGSGVVGDGSTFEFQVDRHLADGTSKKFNFKATRVVPTKVVWDVPKLKKKLDADVLSDVVKREYTVLDMVGLARYVKSLGGSQSKLKSFFLVSESVDEEAMDQAFEVGDITRDDVSGCFSVEVKSESYRVTSREIDQDGEDE